MATPIQYPDKSGKYTYNIIKHRGDPHTATTLTGDIVHKQEIVIIPSPLDGTMISLDCADYHGEHFVYVDPLFAKTLPESEVRQIWFAMCTCGSPAVVLGPGDVAEHDDQKKDGTQVNKLVCMIYHTNLLEHGHGFHMGQSPVKWG